jgi:hypothetical protein
MEMDFPTALKAARAVIDRYMVMEEKEKVKWMYWMFAAAMHGSFPTFPFQFINAMRGSGKSRLLKLSAFILDGIYTTTPTEAVLFRTADPLFIDEAECISSRERSALREVLNAAYKRGLKIRRIRKIEHTGEYKVDEFDVYRPIMLANIDGMDDVLEDRCLKTVLEKAENDNVTRRLEMFDLDADCCALRSFLRLMKMGSVGSVVSDTLNNVLVVLFNYFNILTQHTLTNTYTILTPTYTTDINKEEMEKIGKLMEKIEKSKLYGRDLELWLPLFIISAMYGEDMEQLMAIAEEEAEGKKKNTFMENRDITFLSFLYNFIEDGYKGEWLAAADMVQQYCLNNPADKWFTAEWIGRAMVRNMVIMERRRLSRGREYRLDAVKITDKAIRFGIAVPKAPRPEEQQESLEVKT